MTELFSSVKDLVAVLERPKRMINLGPWLPPQKGGQRGVKLKSSLQVASAALPGITIEIGCNIEGFELPSRVVLMAEIDRGARPMARIDINGSRHENPHAICGEWQHIDAGKTHFHDTRLHVTLTIEELFNGIWDLPVARPIPDMPTDFAKAMEKCGELLHIENLGEIEEPQWQPRQFPF